jgi:hypothetical protein
MLRDQLARAHNKRNTDGYAAVGLAVEFNDDGPYINDEAIIDPLAVDSLTLL